MLVDIVNAGWVPIYNLNLSEETPGYIDAPDKAFELPLKTYFGGHPGRLGTRDNIALHMAYIDDMSRASNRRSPRTTAPHTGRSMETNVWAALGRYLDDVTAAAASREPRAASGSTQQRTVSQQVGGLAPQISGSPTPTSRVGRAIRQSFLGTFAGHNSFS
jgi:hypothetical protein